MSSMGRECAYLNIGELIKATYFDSMFFEFAGLGGLDCCCFFGLGANPFEPFLVLGILDWQTESVSEQSLVTASISEESSVEATSDRTRC
ncbi:hypothetical protein V6N12_023630 [Hibiscus sabdariffa]|uniref:Uncharacterized protein n=1 Tax=Hibiscus sabdariffa TaxID=183260 RepID=A0ABR2FYN7_9ROSI